MAVLKDVAGAGRGDMSDRQRDALIEITTAYKIR
jgi:hypothetical protein